MCPKETSWGLNPSKHLTEKLLPKHFLLYIVSLTHLSNTISQIQTLLPFEEL